MFAPWFLWSALRRMQKASPHRGLQFEHLEDRTAPSATRTIDLKAVIVGVTTPDSWTQLQTHRELTGLDLANSSDLGGGLIKISLNGATPDEAIARLQGLPNVAFASPNYIYNGVTLDAFPADAKANDNYFSQQEGYLKATRIFDSTTTANAWTNLGGSNLGSTATVVAVIDEGIRTPVGGGMHPDLGSDAIWFNGSSTKGDSYGWDFTGDDNAGGTNYYPLNSATPGDNNPAPNPNTLDPYHGEAVASVIAARTNNTQGLAGVAGGNNGTGGVKILPLRVFSTNTNDNVSTETSALAAAITYAADRAKIINMSFGLDQFINDPAISTALNYAYDTKNVITFASAGNTGAQNPARRAFDQVLFVAGTNNAGALSDTTFGTPNYKSAYGSFVDLSMPSEAIVTTGYDNVAGNYNGYALSYGTSLASPMAAGAAALIYAKYGNAYPRDQVLAQLFATATPLGSLNANYKGQMGAGMVNAYDAISKSTATFNAPAFGTVSINGTTLTTGGATPSVNNFTGITLQTPHTAFFGNTEKVLSTFDSSSMVPANFELRADGPDNIFGNSDDTVIPLAFNSPYRVGAESITLNITAPLTSDRYRLATLSTINPLRDPFSNVLDGDNDGLAGGNLVRVFDVVVPVLGGIEVQQNTFTNGDQRTPAVAVFADGSYVQTWASDFIDGSSTAIMARSYDNRGVPKSAEFQVNSVTFGSQTVPRVAGFSDGGFVIVWQSTGFTYNKQTIAGRRFKPDGSPFSGEYTINESIYDRFSPDVAVSGTGFAVTYLSTTNAMDWKVVMDYYSITNNPTNGGQVNVGPITGNMNPPVIAANAAGGFAIAWTSAVSDGSGSSARFRFYDSNGSPLNGSEIQANTYTTGTQSPTGITYTATGNLILTWNSDLQDGTGSAVVQRRFDGAGVPLAAESVVNTYTTGNQSNGRVAVDGVGNYIVVWNDASQDGSGNGIYSQSYSAVGNKIGGENRVNLLTLNDQSFIYGGVSRNAAGLTLIAWHSNNSSNGTYEIQMKRTFTTAQMVTMRPGNDTNEILAGERVVQSLNSIVLSFNNALTANANTASNWQLTVDGVVQPLGTITNPAFNIATGYFEMTLPLTSPILKGNVVVTAKQSIQDFNGNALDGNADGLFGGDFVRSFTVESISVRGPLVRTNTTTNLSQSTADVAVAPDGRSIVVWQGNGEVANNADDAGIFAQLYAADGSAVGSEFRINTFTSPSTYSLPHVGMDAAGNFVVAWNATPPSGTTFVVYRRFTANGTPIGSEATPYSVGSLYGQGPCDIAVNDAGQFTIAWQSITSDGTGDILAQQFNSNGSLATNGFHNVNAWTTGNQTNPKVGMDDAGNVAIAWEDYTQESGSSTVDRGIYTRLFRADGTAVGGDLHVNTTSTNIQSSPALAMDSLGNIAVAWQSMNQAESGYTNVYGQYFNSAGVKVGTEFPLATNTAFNQIAPDVALDTDGDAVFTWATGANPSQFSDVVFQRFNSVGSKVGVEAAVASSANASFSQDLPVVAMDAMGNARVVWSGNGPGDTQGIFTQRLGTNDAPTTTGMAPVTVTEDTASTISFANKFADSAEPYLNLTYTLNTSGGAPFSASLDAANQKLTFTPTANAVGNGVVTIRATDAGGLFVDMPVLVTVAPVNDAPTLALGSNWGNIVRNKYQNLIDVSSWVTSPLPGGGADETAQSVSFEVSYDSNPGLFTTLPQIVNVSGNYHLQFDPVDDVYGAAVIQVRTRDTGGTASGGVDVSAAQTFTITIAPTDISQQPVLQFNGIPRPADNVTTTGSQLNADVATDAAGNYVVVWQGPGTGTGTDIFARLYESNGAPKTSEFRVNTLITAGEQLIPRVAMAPDGKFVVTWTTARPSFSTDVYARRYDARGLAVDAGEFLAHNVNATNDAQSSPDVAIAPNGNFVITWSGQSIAETTETTGIFAQVFDWNVNKLSGEVLVNNQITSVQQQPTVAMDAAANFAVSWTDNANADIYVRTFTPFGVPRQSQFLVNTDQTDTQEYPSLAMDAVGNFVVAYETANRDGNGDGVAAQRFSAAGAKLGTEFFAYPTSGGSPGNVGNQTFPATAMDADGDFVIGWSGANPLDSSGSGSFFQRYKSDGSLVDGTQRASTYTTNGQQNLKLAMDADGDVILAWDGEGFALNGTTVLSQDIFHRRYGFKAPVGIEVNTNNVPSGPTGGEAGFSIPLGGFFTLGGTEAVNNYKVGSITNKALLTGTPTISNDKQLTGRVAPGQQGSAEVTIRINDGTETTTQTLSNNNGNTIIIRVLDDPLHSPVLDFIRDRSIVEGSPLNLTFTAYDPDGVSTNKYTLPFNSGATGVTFVSAADGSSGSLSWTPTDNQTVTFTVRVTDGNGLGTWTQETFDVTVQNANPTATLKGPSSVGVNATPTFMLDYATDASLLDKATLTFAFEFDGVWTAASSSPSILAPASAFSSPGSTSVRARVYDKDNGYTEYTMDVVVSTTTPPATATVTINDGAAQRSLVTNFKVQFSEAVTFPNGIAAAFTVNRTSPGTPNGNVNLNFAQTGNMVTITFNDALYAPGSTGSLIDGVYTLTLNAANILNGGTSFDGDGDGVGGDSKSYTVKRIFFDINGDATINGADLVAFGNAFSSDNPLFDYNADGTINGADLVQFGNRFAFSL
ncbi:hypothetical protein BH11PLA2_BH11PLA2_43420 [soil metagenome]